MTLAGRQLMGGRVDITFAQAKRDGQRCTIKFYFMRHMDKCAPVKFLSLFHDPRPSYMYIRSPTPLQQLPMKLQSLSDGQQQIRLWKLIV